MWPTAGNTLVLASTAPAEPSASPSRRATVRTRSAASRPTAGSSLRSRRRVHGVAQPLAGRGGVEIHRHPPPRALGKHRAGEQVAAPLLPAPGEEIGQRSVGPSPAARRGRVGAGAPEAGHPADQLGEHRVGAAAAGRRRRVAVEREDDDGGRRPRGRPAVGGWRARRCRQRWRAWRRARSAPTADPGRAVGSHRAGATSAAANSRAPAKRSSGSLASARSIASAAGAGTSGRSSRRGRGLAERCCAMTSRGVSPRNGGVPASIS